MQLQIEGCGKKYHQASCACESNPSGVTIWRRNNPARALEMNRKHTRIAQSKGYHIELYHRHKAEALARYGGVCVCCGESDIGFLTFDHKEPIGNQRKRRMSNKVAVRQYRTGPIDPNIQVMCFNCNCGRAANGGVCPHQEAR